MSYRKNSLIYLFSMLIQGCSPDSPATKLLIKPTQGTGRAKIPSAWIEKVRRYDYRQDCRPLLAELEGYIKPDTLDGTGREPHLDGGVLHPEAPGGRLNPVFINLDEDPAEELVGLFGYARCPLSLCVFKQVGPAWQLLYRESFDLFNEQQELQLVNNFSSNKLFYVRKLYARGTCTYGSGYQFYKLIGGRVYPCLELLKESSSCPTETDLGRAVTVSLQFNSTTADEIWVRYRYDFYTENSASDLSDAELPLLIGEKGFACVWDSFSHTYKPDFNTAPDGLNKEKLRHLEYVEDDKKFVHDFSYEINQVLKAGSAEQKVALCKYLAYANKKK